MCLKHNIRRHRLRCRHTGIVQRAKVSTEMQANGANYLYGPCSNGNPNTHGCMVRCPPKWQADPLHLRDSAMLGGLPMAEYSCL
jgi:hypothetical protein